MIIVGHRGVAGHYPENTKVSIEAALQLGLDWVEVDVQPSKDNQLVICHDHSIDRCSNGRGRIDELTLQQLMQYDFGSWFDEKFKQQSIMTLAELFTLAQSHQLKLNLEIKIDRHDPKHVCQLLKQQLIASNANPDDILLSSFNHQVIRELHHSLPDYKLGVLCQRLDKATNQLLDKVNAYSCNISYKWVSKREIDQLKERGYQVWSYTVNDPKTLIRLPNLDAIFSDYPERFFSA